MMIQLAIDSARCLYACVRKLNNGSFDLHDFIKLQTTDIADNTVNYRVAKKASYMTYIHIPL